MWREAMEFGGGDVHKKYEAKKLSEESRKKAGIRCIRSAIFFITSP